MIVTLVMEIVVASELALQGAYHTLTLKSHSHLDVHADSLDHGVRNLLEQDRPEARIERADTLVLEGRPKPPKRPEANTKIGNRARVPEPHCCVPRLADIALLLEELITSEPQDALVFIRTR